MNTLEGKDEDELGSRKMRTAHRKGPSLAPTIESKFHVPTIIIYLAVHPAWVGVEHT